MTLLGVPLQDVGTHCMCGKIVVGGHSPEGRVGADACTGRHTHSFVVAIALLRYGHIVQELSQLANVIVAGLIE